MTEPSPSPKLLRGTSGQDEIQPASEKKTSGGRRRTRAKEVISPLSEAPSSPPDVEVAAEDHIEPTALTPADLKLAIKMNKHIMGALGLKTRNRSFRV